MVFLDESSKDGHTIFRKYGRAPLGERPVIQESVDRGTRYSILPAITVDGYIAVRVVEGSVDGAEFFDFVLHDVVSMRDFQFCSFSDFGLASADGTTRVEGHNYG